MCGLDIRREKLFSYKTQEEWVPADHPLRLVRVLVEMSDEHFSVDGALIAGANAEAVVPASCGGSDLRRSLPEIRPEAETGQKKTGKCFFSHPIRPQNRDF